MSDIYVALTNNYWGVGPTPGAAKLNAKKAGARARVNERKWLVKRMPDGAVDVRVDGMGCITWRWADDADHEALPKIVEAPLGYPNWRA